MKRGSPLIRLFVGIILVASVQSAEARKDKGHLDLAEAAAESTYYKIIGIPIPDDVVLECGGMEIMPDNTLAVSTRRGDIYMITGAYDDPPTNVKFTRWATGMHEVLGLAFNSKDGYLYAVQRGEVTRLKDTHRRGHADVYETFCDNWGISGDYHEYPWMSKFDTDGNLYVAADAHRLIHQRIGIPRLVPQDHSRRQSRSLRQRNPLAGRRSAGTTRASFSIADNQGPWNGGCALAAARTEGSFQGHPIGNKWYDKAPNMGTRPLLIPQSGRVESTSKPKKSPELLAAGDHPAL